MASLAHRCQCPFEITTPQTSTWTGRRKTCGRLQGRTRKVTLQPEPADPQGVWRQASPRVLPVASGALHLASVLAKLSLLYRALDMAPSSWPSTAIPLTPPAEKMSSRKGDAQCSRPHLTVSPRVKRDALSSPLVITRHLIGRTEAHAARWTRLSCPARCSFQMSNKECIHCLTIHVSRCTAVHTGGRALEISR